MKTLTLAIAVFLLTLGVLPEDTSAQYHGVTHHRVSRRASRMRRPGWNQAQAHQAVPELDPNAAGAGLVLLLGGFLVIQESRARRSALSAK